MQICQYHNKKLCIFAVAPFAGAWIEIYAESCVRVHEHVAPFAGAWIEINLSIAKLFINRRSLRGSVD